MAKIKVEEAPVIPAPAAVTPQAPRKQVGGAREGAGRKRSGLTKFGEWANKEGLNSRQLAEKLEISQSMASQLITGVRRPGYELMGKIHDLTNGEVSYDAWRKN